MKKRIAIITNYPVINPLKILPQMTAKNHFKKLPSEIAEKAIKNTPEENLHKNYEKTASAIAESFRWNKSPEGFVYWHKIFKEALKN